MAFVKFIHTHIFFINRIEMSRKDILFLFIVSSCVLFACSPKLSPDNNWEDKRWVLAELKGVPVQLSGTNRDAHLFFSPSDKRYTGSGGCNRINGSYEISKRNKIRFGDAVATRMTCPDIRFENTFLSALKEVDSYELYNKTMLLKDGNEIVMKLKLK